MEGFLWLWIYGVEQGQSNPGHSTEPTDAFIFKCFPNLEAELNELNVPSLDDVEMVFSSCWRSVCTGQQYCFPNVPQACAYDYNFIILLEVLFFTGKKKNAISIHLLPWNYSFVTTFCTQLLWLKFKFFLILYICNIWNFFFLNCNNLDMMILCYFIKAV